MTEQKVTYCGQWHRKSWGYDMWDTYSETDDRVLAEEALKSGKPIQPDLYAYYNDKLRRRIPKSERRIVRVKGNSSDIAEEYKPSFVERVLQFVVPYY